MWYNTGNGSNGMEGMDGDGLVLAGRKHDQADATNRNGTYVKELVGVNVINKTTVH